VFRILGVFVSGWTVAAATQICHMDRDADDLLDRLADRSLIVTNDNFGNEELRFQLARSILG